MKNLHKMSFGFIKKSMTRTFISFLSFLIIFSLMLPSGCAKKEKVIKIGVILPLTGEAAKYGQSAKRGLDLALEEINASGGVRGKKLSLIYEDSKADPKEGVNAIQKLITIHKVPAIIGAMASSVTLAIAPIAEKNKVVLLSPASSAPKITYAGNYIFRNCYSDIYEGTKMADYIWNETSYRSIAIIYINNDYGIGLKRAFEKRFTELGGKVIISEPYEFGSTDFHTQISKVKNANPDAIYIIGYGEMGRLLIQAKEIGLSKPFFSCIMFEDPDILKIAREAAEGVIYTFPSYDPKSQEKQIRDFVRAFKKKYGQIPDGFAANSYDALKILALAIKKGGGDSEGIKDALYTVRDFPGVTGKTSFDANGDVKKPIGIKTVKDGRFIWLKFRY